MPRQTTSTVQYKPEDGLARGTLFPGLDLPFGITQNPGVPNVLAGTPAGELYAIGFAANELTLYLDTHPRDSEGFNILKELLTLKDKAYAEYVKRYGALRINDLTDFSDYDWTQKDFPWVLGGAK